MDHQERIGMLTFFAVAFGGSWAGWTYAGDSELSILLFPAFCSLAGFVASFAEGGARGLNSFASRTTHLAGTFRFLVLALIVPIALGLIYLLFHVSPLPPLNPVFSKGLGITLLVALWTGPVAEEFGWRGYLQPKLARRMPPLLAAVLIGLLWCAWHLPMFYSTVFSTVESTIGFAAFCVTWSIFLAYLVDRAGWSVWPAIALHWSANTHADVLGALFPSIDGSQLPGGPNTTVWYLLAAVIFVLLNWRFFTTRAHFPGHA